MVGLAIRAWAPVFASLAMVETGGDPGHAPARHVYERAGYQLLPVARYFKEL